MVIAPPIEWPSEFLEQGPEGDSGILLTGEARLAGIRFKVMALRVPQGGRNPDFRDDIDEEEYAASLGGIIEAVEELAESIAPATIAMNGGHYLLWMVPHPSP